MGARPGVWYEARIAFGVAALLPLLLIPLHALQVRGAVRGHIGLNALDGISWGFEHFLPLAELGATHLMTVERETGFAELRQSYPESPWRLPLIRTIGGGGLLVVAALLGSVAYTVTTGTYPLSETLIPALAPAVWFLGIGLLLGNLTGNFWVAAGAMVGYWWFEVLVGREVSGVLYLFQHSRPALDVATGLNRALLTSLGVVLLALNAYLSARRPGGWR